MAQVGNSSSNSSNPADTSIIVTYSVVASFAALFCLFGLLGNAVVIWILSFKIKRSKYTVYILNLAVADFIYLLFVAVVMILMVSQMVSRRSISPTVIFALEVMYDFGYAASMLFLTSISVERCLSVLFPIWYKCYRPKHISSFTCGLIWLLGCLFSLLDNFVCPPDSFQNMSKECTGVQVFSTVVTFVFIIPLMLLSSFILIYIVKSTSKKSRPPKIYIAIILTVMVFLISVAPIRLLWSLLYFKSFTNKMSALAFFFTSTYCTIFNSGANPFIYFFVGRHRKKRFGGSVNEALTRVFKDDDTEQSSLGNSTSMK
ncbi:proto-oncogene Mas-like [Rana temporaria]|uniref:proto-oncogene Mas-like n=1 Tax=Rana temporaria TaxID=8407 RepID=UPI001AADEB44|nr:proto-oncogene Mas-like [Rana temporaria]XP_040198793.1 proto-oncogene Mas-like [Rana temporaria]